MEEVESKIKSAESTLDGLKQALKSGADDECALKNLVSYKKESREIVKLLVELETKQREEEKIQDQAYWVNQCIEYEKNQISSKISHIRSYESPQLKLVMEENKGLILELDGTKLDHKIH